MFPPFPPSFFLFCFVFFETESQVALAALTVFYGTKTGFTFLNLLPATLAEEAGSEWSPACSAGFQVSQADLVRLQKKIKL